MNLNRIFGRSKNILSGPITVVILAHRRSLITSFLDKGVTSAYSTGNQETEVIMGINKRSVDTCA